MVSVGTEVVAAMAQREFSFVAVPGDVQAHLAVSCGLVNDFAGLHDFRFDVLTQVLRKIHVLATDDYLH